jgi:undecaprenol kinase
MLKPLLKSFAYAFRGIYITFKTERNFKIHLVGLVITVAMGIYLGLSIEKWGLIIFSAGFVLVAELFNTAVERLGDEAAGGKLNHIVRDSKDIAAGAVLLSTITALIIGIIVLFIPFIQKMFDLH